MSPEELAALVSERLGAEIQALTLVWRGLQGVQTVEAWQALVPAGRFWVVQSGADIELFHSGRFPGRASLAMCASATDAVERFVELHPHKQQ